MSADLDQGDTPAEDGAARAAKRFAAFISYAHADETVAARLHKQIETYRLPGTLRAVAGGEIAARLGKVFRDRADLAAADSLSEAIRDALANSDALIVLCSPAAVQSRWVNEEIRLFRELNPGAPVLAAVVRGEPADAMPEALTEAGREPLAADLREEGDGKKLGFLKIVAALAGVPLDALIQRDAQRNLRRVMAVTAGAMVAFLIMAGMTTYAIQQRNEANRQRAQAEGLVEFMLTDLRERLRGVGNIDIMGAVNERALSMYRSQGDLSELPDDSLERRARVLMAMGEDNYRRSNRRDSLRQFSEAYRNTQALLGNDPGSPDRIFAHAQSAFWMGYVRYRARENRAAQPYWDEYYQLALRLEQLDPDRRRAAQELGYAEGNLCSLAIAREQPAIAMCTAALRNATEVARSSDGDASAQLDVANRLGWLADAIEAERGVPASIVYRERQLAITRSVATSDPDNWDYREYLVNALYSLGLRHRNTSDVAAGLRLLNEAKLLIATMRRRDPANERWADLDRLISISLSDQRETVQ